MVNTYQQIVSLFMRSDEGRRHVHYFAAIPDELIPYIPGFWWNNDKLFALKSDVAPVPLADLDHLLNIPIWRATQQTRLFGVSGNNILASPDRFQDHWERSMAADLSYPIVLHRRTDGIILLDGYHRLLKAKHLGAGEINAMYLSQSTVESILEREGFPGELNAAAECEPNFVEAAKSVAISLLQEGDTHCFPAWE